MGANKIRKVGMLMALVGLVSTIAPLEAGAASSRVRAPGRATIVVVESTPTTRNRHHIRVTVQLPRQTAATPVSSTEVKVGNRTCTIKRTQRSCMVRNVTTNWQTVSITARAKNRAGFGKASTRVRFDANRRRWIRAGYSATGIKIPAPIVAVGNTRLLSSSERMSRMQSLNRGGVQSASVPVASSSNASTITFLTSGVVGLAMADGSSMSASGLYAVRGDGSTIDAVRTGSANIQDFYVAPNNRYYVVFRSPVELATGQPKCVLAEVDFDTGNPRCVDYKVASMNNMTHSMMMSGGKNPSVQFDSAGNIYYVSHLYADVDECFQSHCNSLWRPVLRKAANGTVVTLLNEYVEDFNFLAEGNGAVIVSGRTGVTSATWTRRIAPNGSLRNLDATSRSTFMRYFADGNIYMGMQGSGSMGVRRFLTSASSMDSKWWINGPYNSSTGSYDGYYTSYESCSYGNGFSSNQAFCSTSGSMLKYSFNFGNSITLVVPGHFGSNGSRLMQYFPSLEVLDLSITNVTVAEKVGDKLAVAGTTAEGVNSLVIYDPVTFQETIVMDASNQTEIYSLAYIASTGKLMFNGLDFATNRYVMGEVTIP